MSFSNRSFDYSSKQLIPCVVMDESPTEKTRGAIGVLCIHRESGNLYKCVAANYCDNVFTWKIVGDVSDDEIRQSVSDFLSQNPMNGGLSDAEKNLLLTLFRGAVYQSETAEETAAAYSNLQNLWRTESKPDSTDLTSISATYNGGDVAVGTAVSDLTGIVVTATYSDGTSKTVTDYTLSGTIAEGSNTITVSYGGKTTTFAVTGMTVQVEEQPVEMSPWYLYGGSTLYSDNGETDIGKDCVTKACSVNPFEVDTIISFTYVNGDTTLYQPPVFACLETPVTANSQYPVGYYAEAPTHVECGSSNGGQLPAGETHTYTYTVKAGYYLFIGYLTNVQAVLAKGTFTITGKAV